MTKDITYLSPDFIPGEKDVIVGRGKVCYKHSGNVRLVAIVQSALAEYSDMRSTKKSKSELIKRLVAQVRDSSPEGGFVKLDGSSGQWYEVGDRIAREKVSQTFRDALNDKYKSSTTSKTLKRRQERINRQVSAGSSNSSASFPASVDCADSDSCSQLSSSSGARAAPEKKSPVSPLNLMASVATSKLYQNDYGLAGPATVASSYSRLDLMLAAKRQTMLQDMMLARQIRQRAFAASLSFPRYN